MAEPLNKATIDAVSVHGMYPDKFRQLYGEESEMLEDVQRQLDRRIDCG